MIIKMMREGELLRIIEKIIIQQCTLYPDIGLYIYFETIGSICLLRNGLLKITTLKMMPQNNFQKLKNTILKQFSARTVEFLNCSKSVFCNQKFVYTPKAKPVGEDLKINGWFKTKCLFYQKSFNMASLEQ